MYKYRRLQYILALKQNKSASVTKELTKHHDWIELSQLKNKFFIEELRTPF